MMFLPKHIFNKSNYYYIFMIGTTSACALKLFRNTVALEKDDEQVSFINMRIKDVERTSSTGS